LGYKGFKNYGLQIVAVHDADPAKMGKRVYGLKIQPMEKIEDTIKRIGVNIAILTVPEDYVQEIADRLVDAGITGIWNFAPKNLKLPESVVVQRTDLATCFAELSSRLNQVLVRQKIDRLHDDRD
jgi:redox-sensing transcriptional repressor